MTDRIGPLAGVVRTAYQEGIETIVANIAPGALIAERYKLVERIGRGGMAEVWLGQDVMLGRQVAVKVILPQFSQNPEFVTRFRHEAVAAANLSNPYIVNVYDWGQDGPVQYMIMEYVNGQDLKQMIRAKGALPTRSAARIGAQVCQALSTAHHLDIVHRDVKPQNIMIQRNGNVKVMDFGIARAKNSTDDRTKMVLGTAQYVSPEQAQGGDLGAASDIYSLGIVLYEAVTGALPFDGDDAVSVALKHVEEPPVPPSAINPDVDPAFEAIIMRALAKDPDERFISVQEMGHALDDYANGIRDFSAVTTTFMASNNPRTRSSAARTQAMPAAYRGQEPAADDPAAETKRKRIIIAAIAAGIAILAVLIAVIVGMLVGGKVEVPDVTGQDADSAIEMIESAGLAVGEVTDVPSADVDAGLVVGTDPDAGAELDKGSAVDIQVSSGPAQVDVPDLIGMTEGEAKRALESAGLRGKRGPDEFSSTIEEGKVTSQSPTGGSSVEAGSVIVYAISAGTDTVSVPDLSGMTEQAAMDALKAIGLTGLVGSRQASDTVESGHVISQNPAKDVKVEIGSQVTFTVSTGIAAVTVPALEGLTQTAARSTLINAGLELGDVTEEYSSEPKGTVISQSVSQGASVEKGSRVDVVISKGEDPKQNTSSSAHQGGSSAAANASSR